jgi:ketosteroid isomerase-like protein
VEAGQGDAEQVLAANEAFYAAFNQKDVAAMERAWSHQEHITCIHPGWNLLRGRDEVLESWRAILANPDQARIVVGGAGVTIMGGAGLVLCRELVGGMPLAATNLFVQEGGTWKLLHHHSGPVSPAAA